jgi:hypothetical protein
MKLDTAITPARIAIAPNARMGQQDIGWSGKRAIYSLGVDRQIYTFCAAGHSGCGASYILARLRSERARSEGEGR